MFRFYRAYEKTAEFKSRQDWLFGGLDRICIEAAQEIGEHIAATVKKTLKALAFGKYRFSPVKKALQLVLEMDVIAQAPLFKQGVAPFRMPFKYASPQGAA